MHELYIITQDDNKHTSGCFKALRVNLKESSPAAQHMIKGKDVKKESAIKAGSLETRDLTKPIIQLESSRKVFRYMILKSP